MAYVVAVVAGIIGAVVGWFVTAGITAWVAGLFGMSDFEGGRGMFAGLVVGPVGGLIAMGASVWLVLRWEKGVVPVGWMLLRTATVLAAIAALVVAIIALRLYTLDTYTSTLPPTLEFQIRIPATLSVPERSSLRVEVHTDKNIGDGELAEHWSPGDGAYQVIGGRVSLTRKTWSRLLVVSMPGQPTRLFKLSLPRDPQTMPTLNEWRHPDLIAVEGEETARAAPADDPLEMRFRVRRAGDDWAPTAHRVLAYYLFIAVLMGLGLRIFAARRTTTAERVQASRGAA